VKTRSRSARQDYSFSHLSIPFVSEILPYFTESRNGKKEKPYTRTAFLFELSDKTLLFFADL
jgi:hypothetical protein